MLLTERICVCVLFCLFFCGSRGLIGFWVIFWRWMRTLILLSLHPGCGIPLFNSLNGIPSHLGWYLACLFIPAAACMGHSIIPCALALSVAVIENTSSQLSALQDSPLIYGTVGCKHVSWYLTMTLPVPASSWMIAKLLSHLSGGANLTNDLSCQR